MGCGFSRRHGCFATGEPSAEAHWTANRPLRHLGSKAERIFAHRRLGEVLPGTLDDRMREFVAATPKLAMVDVTGAANFDAGNGHAYFRTSPWVSTDVLMTLRYGLSPEERGLVRQIDSPIWRFPGDYVRRFEAALGTANPELRALAED